GRLFSQGISSVDLPALSLLRNLEPASVDVLGRVRNARLQRRHLRAASELMTTARPEVAALWGIDQGRGLSGNGRQSPRGIPIHPSDRTEQSPGVGMLRVVEDLV